MNSTGADDRPLSLLTINSGSSSLKFALISGDGEPQIRFSGMIERIGQSGARLRSRAHDRSWTTDESIEAANHAQAADRLRQYLEASVGWSAISISSIS